MQMKVALASGSLLTLCAVNLLLARTGIAQESCYTGSRVEGTVWDSTHAAVRGAKVRMDSEFVTATSPLGRYVFSCVPEGKHSLDVSAATFAEKHVDFEKLGSSVKEIDIILSPQQVSQAVEVDSHDPNERGSGELTISGDNLSSLADDPDDLLRQLQGLAMSSGGAGGIPLITVNGFELESRLPPKNSISFVRVNPDLYTAEYAAAPYEGGRVDIYTKPGQQVFHGDAFGTTSDAFLNARDPFSTSRAAIGKQRLGFDLSGPGGNKQSDFALSLEHRTIDDFAVVNATTLDSSYQPTQTIENVPVPQHLWEASAQWDWLATPRNTINMSYIANVNHLDNVGAGGTTLAEAASDSIQQEHTVRFSDIMPLSSRLMHESRLSVRFRTRTDTPNSNAAQIQVAGAFTAGGASEQQEHTSETGIEYLDDFVLSHGPHILKAGVQLDDLIERESLPQNFNGTYIFGGSIAPVLDGNGNPVPGELAAINSLEQYRRTVLSLPGGMPTAFTQTTGSPRVDFSQFQFALYGEDQWKLRTGLQFSYGLRYALQVTPSSYRNIAPRLGLAWSPDRKRKWTLQAHLGIFFAPLTTAAYAEQQQLNGKRTTASTIYSPTYDDPYADSTAIETVRTYAPSVGQTPSLETQVALDRHLSHSWDLSASVLVISVWNGLRTLNINSPINGSPAGPRPGLPNLNILQYQQSGAMRGQTILASIGNYSLKRFSIYALYVHVRLRGNMDTAPTFSPQSSRTDEGEWAQVTGRSRDNFVSTGQVNLPSSIKVSYVFRAASTLKVARVSSGEY